MKTQPIEEFQAECKAQGVAREDVAVICPACGTIQSSRDLVAAGVSELSADQYLGYSCVGRFTGAPSPRKDPDGKPCNWTLGGLLRLHNLEVLTGDGKRVPSFELATPEQAQAHALTRQGVPS